jgi:hypothetical protein
MCALLTIITAGTAFPQSIPFGGQINTNAGPPITFTAATVSSSGINPGDSMMLVGFVIDREANTASLTTPAFDGSADAGGVFAVTVTGGIKPRSIWLLIDRTTGGYTVAEPEGSVLRQMPDGSIEIHKETIASPLASATIHRAHTHVFRIAAMIIQTESRRLRILGTTPPPPPDPPRLSDMTVFDAKDGSETDNDGVVDGLVRLVFPESLRVGDYLFVVDDHTLEFRVLALDACNLNGECN